MQGTTGQFRSVAFGGFHRQDVLDYIEQLTREHRAQLETMKRELTGEREARSQAEARLRQAQEEAGARAALEDQLIQAQAALEKANSTLIQAQAQAAALEEKLQTVEPEAASWQRIKDTAGGIEVAAHERAQVTVQAARVQAGEIRAEAARWVLEIQARCQRVQRDLHTAVSAAETELDAVRVSFSQAEGHLETIQGALSQLATTTEEVPEDR